MCVFFAIGGCLRFSAAAFTRGTKTCEFFHHGVNEKPLGGRGVDGAAAVLICCRAVAPPAYPPPKYPTIVSVKSQPTPVALFGPQHQSPLFRPETFCVGFACFALCFPGPNYHGIIIHPLWDPHPSLMGYLCSRTTPPPPRNIPVVCSSS